MKKNTAILALVAVVGVAFLMPKSWQQPDPVDPQAGDKLVGRATALTIGKRLRDASRDPLAFQVVKVTGEADGRRLCFELREANATGGLDITAAELANGKVTRGACKPGPVDFSGMRALI